MLAFVLSWPRLGHVLQGPFWRRLADLSPQQLSAVSLVALLFVASIITSTNIVLLWGCRRLDLETSPSTSDPKRNGSQDDNSTAAIPLSRTRWAVALAGSVVLVLFLRDVITRWSWAVCGGVAVVLFCGLITILLLDYAASCMDLHDKATCVELITVPVRLPRYLKSRRRVPNSAGG